ncbi:hypothetical protein ACA910_003871 [Epithemia clementina (nom. ined.)]
MKQNYETCIVGQVCTLVPYRPCHVERYHEWMQNVDLLEATGSEPLSLEEEYEMQNTWRLDNQKCTFIVLDKSKCIDIPNSNNNNNNNKNNSNNQADVVTSGGLTTPTSAITDARVVVDADFILNNTSAMVGDVNLFLSEEESDDGSGSDHGNTTNNNNNNDNNNNNKAKEPPTAGGEQPRKVLLQAEVDIMVAEHVARGKGIGKEATCLMIKYGTECLGIQRFFAKINANNAISRRLFHQTLRFVECDYAECFQQYEYELRRHRRQEQQQQDEKKRDAIDECLNGQDLVVFTCKAEH